MLHFATWSKSICNTPFNERYGILQGAKFMSIAALLSVRPALQARAFTLVIIFNCAMVRSFVRRRRRRRRRSSYPKNPPNCARCCWRARVPVKRHLADLRFRFLAREIDLKSWNHVFQKSVCTVQSIIRVSARIIPPVHFWRF